MQRMNRCVTPASNPPPLFFAKNVIGSPRKTLKTLNAKDLHESKDSPIE